jgi:hypothetical protein
MCGMGRWGIEEVGEDEGIHQEFVWAMKKISWRVMGGMKKGLHT